ncbi:hypothetical protein sS8_0235 [Methylocaldum marinum]|uniref:Uncharacterized protein n=1 Tax=Methylocaldum marinum TaxID=1432792 RepID=A0A286P3I1_9GAMM|nr:hypothetical protein sS8_0235 [Methylocaldum marinum]
MALLPNEYLLADTRVRLPVEKHPVPDPAHRVLNRSGDNSGRHAFSQGFGGAAHLLFTPIELDVFSPSY